MAPRDSTGRAGPPPALSGDGDSRPGKPLSAPGLALASLNRVPQLLRKGCKIRAARCFFVGAGSHSKTFRDSRPLALQRQVREAGFEAPLGRGCLGFPSRAPPIRRAVGGRRRRIFLSRRKIQVCRTGSLCRTWRRCPHICIFGCGDEPSTTVFHQYQRHQRFQRHFFPVFTPHYFRLRVGHCHIRLEKPGAIKSLNSSGSSFYK